MISCTFADGVGAALRHVVVHAVVERAGALLLVRRADHLHDAGKWGLPGGFLDLGETLGDGVLRELREETGWDGRVVRLFRISSSPDRPQQNVDFAFVVTPTERRGRPDAETAAVEWFPFERLPSPDALTSDHGETIRAYLATRTTPPRHPILV
jgi:ADP-ribose pyrophosphatase YjhB (NUDIX family)